MLNVFSYFPTLIYRDEHPEWTDYLKKVTEKYFMIDEKQTVFQTSDMKNDSELQFLFDYLLRTSMNILEEQGYIISKYDFFISDLWGQEIKQGGFTDVHVHKNSQICGWIFLETPENGSYPLYYDTRMNKEIIELDAIVNDQIWASTSKIIFNNIFPGTVLLTNSWMKHQLTQNTSVHPTKAIHFIISHKDKLCNMC